MHNVFSHAQIKPTFRGTILAAITAIGAGMVNGLLGTGGGILLLLVLRRRIDTQNAFASALACILPLSMLSAWLYARNGTLTADVFCSPQVLPYLLGAVPGGVLGAVLLNRLKLSVVQLLFTALLLFSGWRMVFS